MAVIPSPHVLPDYTAAVARILERGRAGHDEIYSLSLAERAALKQECIRGGYAVEDNVYDRTFRFYKENMDRGTIRRMEIPARAFGVAHANEELQINIEYEDIDLNQLAAAIMEHKRELMDYWNTEADFILIGEEEFRALTRTAYKHQIFEFNMPDPKFMGLRFRVTPTISGWCIVPKAK